MNIATGDKKVLKISKKAVLQHEVFLVSESAVRRLALFAITFSTRTEVFETPYCKNTLPTNLILTRYQLISVLRIGVNFLQELSSRLF